MSEAVGKHSDHRVHHCNDTHEANKHRLVTGTVTITPGSRMKCEQLRLIFVTNSWSQFKSNSLDILRTPGDISSRVSLLWRPKAEFYLKLDLFHPWLWRSKQEWCSLNSNQGVSVCKPEQSRSAVLRLERTRKFSLNKSPVLTFSICGLVETYLAKIILVIWVELWCFRELYLSKLHSDFCIFWFIYTT